MKISKSYYYHKNGKVEIIEADTNPSQLKRAHVPKKMIDEYNSARSALNLITTNRRKNETDDQRAELDKQEEKARKKCRKAQAAIENFLTNQEMEQFGEINVVAIRKLLDSNIPANRIQKATGVQRANIGFYRNGVYSLSQMTLGVAYQLSNYAKKVL